MRIINGNNIELLKEFPDNYFDAVITDPPYGLGKEPDALEVMKSWVETGFHEVKGKGFMGKEWDAFVPQPLFWKEVYRVLKHGGHVVSFFGTRTYDWGVMAMRFAGFEVRDCIQWLYGSGFPKSHNVSKAIDKMHGAKREVVGVRQEGYAPMKNGHTDKRGGGFIGDERSPKIEITISSTEDAKQWDGWGTALKPANEPIVLARKPLENGLSIAENVLKWGTGGINIDGCRVGVESRTFNSKRIASGFGNYVGGGKFEGQGEINVSGRFPANLILTHHPECECKGFKKVKGSNYSPDDVGKGRIGDYSNGIYGAKSSKVTISHTDQDGMEEVEDWLCHEDCPIRIMDEQSGVSKSTGGSGEKSMGGLGVNGKYGKFSLDTKGANIGGLGDSGGASRFFYCAKASKSERNKGLEGFEEKQSVGGGGGIGEYLNDVNSSSGKYGSEKAPNKNFHPTIKPVKLMQYLVRLITPPNGIVLDPFMGSGTTGIACKLEGFDFVGMEQDPEYCKIAEARISNYVSDEIDEEKSDETQSESKWKQTNLFE